MATKITIFAVSMICIHTVWDRLNERIAETASRDVICYTTDESKAKEIQALYSDNKATIKAQQMDSAQLSRLLDDLEEQEAQQHGISYIMWDKSEFDDLRTLFAQAA